MKKPYAEPRDAHLERVIETTKRLITEVGAERITIRGLAAASGVAPNTLYNNFGSKEQLIVLALFDHYERNIGGDFVAHRNEQSSLENFLYVLKLLVRTCERHPGFARTMVGIYFKIGDNRQIMETMYGTIYSTWLPLLIEMQEQGGLCDWTSVEVLNDEMCQRAFASLLKWARDEVSLSALYDHAAFGVLSILVGASSGKQAQEIQQMLKELLSKPVMKKKRASKPASGTKSPARTAGAARKTGRRA